MAIVRNPYADDADVFIESFRPATNAIWAVIARAGIRSADRDDVFREILRMSYEAWPSFRWEAAFSTLCVTIARRQVPALARLLRKVEATEPDVVAQIVMPGECTAHESLIKSELDEAIDTLLGALSPSEQDVMFLTLAGCTDAEIVAELGMVMGTLWSKRSRAREKIRAGLRQKGLLI